MRRRRALVSCQVEIPILRLFASSRTNTRCHSPSLRPTIHLTFATWPRGGGDRHPSRLWRGGTGARPRFRSHRVLGLRRGAARHPWDDRASPPTPVQTPRRPPALSGVLAGRSPGQGAEDHPGPRRDHRLRRTARPLAGIFSPLRRGLRLDSHNVSTAIPGKIARVAARGGSFDDAAKSLTDLAEITISGRQLGRIAHEVGEQLRDHRDRRAEEFQNRQPKPEVSVVPRLAAMSGDGGRLRTRSEEPGQNLGVHDAAWREDKVADLLTMCTRSHDHEPHPELPRCFMRWRPPRPAGGTSSRRNPAPSSATAGRGAGRCGGRSFRRSRQSSISSAS